MKKINLIYTLILVLATMLFLSACDMSDTTPLDSTMPIGSDSMESMEDMDKSHMGCQEDEISANGECIPAADNNRALFEQDLSGTVVSFDIDSQIGGFVARPVDDGSYPGIILIHEWWGLNQNIKDMAEILAAEGYIVYAVDLYGGEVATNSSDAGRLAGSVRSNPQQAVEVMSAAKTYLENEGATTLGSMGWCFGGQQSLLISTSTPLDATVIYYGSLTDNVTTLSNLNGPVLGVFGEDDGSISVESVENFESALDSLNIENDIYIYEGVGHAFANPSGTNFAPDQTLDAWSRTVDFLNKNLK